MEPIDDQLRAGLRALRAAVLESAQLLGLQHAAEPAVSAATTPSAGWLLTETEVGKAEPRQLSRRAAVGYGSASGSTSGGLPDRVAALVDLARHGDAEAFGQLYDHYVGTIYRFLYYRVGAHALAEDLTSETFFRALRAMGSFRWQGKDFGAWLVTIARNLVADHFKSGCYRLEVSTDEILSHDSTTEGVEDGVINGMTNAMLIEAVRELPSEQQECVVLRFLQGMSIADTAKALGRSEGAIKQLQLRAVRKLAKALPEALR